MGEKKMYAILVNDHVVAVVVEGVVKAFVSMLVSQLPLTTKIETQERIVFNHVNKDAVDLGPAESAITVEDTVEEVKEETE